MTAVIMAGGKGTRLSRYTTEIPKPMIKIASKPVLEYQIEEFKKNDVTDIIITVGYLKDAIERYFGDGSKFGVNIRYIEEELPLGSGGSFAYLKGKVSDTFIAVYGDVLFSVDIRRILEFHRTKNADITLAVHPNSHPYDSDLVISDQNGLVEEFNKKNSDRSESYYHNMVNAGFFIIDAKTLGYFREIKRYDLEKDFISYWINKKSVFAYHTTEYIKDMGTYDRLDSVENDVVRGIISRRNLSNKQKCIFLDRDGTLNVLKGFITDPDQIELEDSVSEAVKLINDSGYLAIVITNQPVIARGLCDFSDLEHINEKIEMLLGENGAYIDDLFFCPHHPDAGYPGERKEYKIKCKCRKPGIELIEKAADKYNIDIKQSWMVGDSTMDIQTGINAGMHTVLLETGESGKDGKYKAVQDYKAANLFEAVKHILDK